MIQQSNCIREQARTRANGHTEHSPVRVALILANAIDCEAMSALFSRDDRLEIVEASADVDYSLNRCRRLFPQVLVIDPKSALDLTQRAADEVGQACVRHVIVLDDRLHESRVATVLAMPSVSYLTRQAGFSALVDAIIQGATGGKRSIDLSVSDRVRRTSRGWRLEQSQERPSVASLTVREIEVMSLLARGISVRMCAKQLKLAESTIDNHKSRLMKKLKIHKAAELTHMAIRDGLISV